MSPKKVIVLGTYHEVQHVGHHLNARFRGAIELLIQEYGVQIILEEWWYKPEPSFAASLATATLKYANIGTPNEPRFKTSTECLNNNPPTYDPSKPRLQEYGPLDVQELREKYMTERISEFMKPCNVGLLIIGLAHLHSIISKLTQFGFEVHGYNFVE
jgi:hypothetical protein